MARLFTFGTLVGVKNEYTLFESHEVELNFLWNGSIPMCFSLRCTFLAPLFRPVSVSHPRGGR